MKKKLLIIIPIAAAVIAAWLAFCGYQWSWGPFVKLHDVKTASLEGNGEKYSLDNTPENADNPIKGKTVIFLGSSRLKKLDAEKADLLVCQLSTNDASQKKELGKIIESKNLNDFDTKTVAGAIEYIICYAKEKWNCSVIFYTSPRYDSERYQSMVDTLKAAQEKWGISVIDMWNDDNLNAALSADMNLYMADKIHPTKAGYREIWTPFMEREIFAVMSAKEVKE